MRRQPRRGRCRAARRHQLPQLRQPREARRRLAARPRDRRAGRSLPRPRSYRWSAATSRSTTRLRRARSTRPRWSAWSVNCPTRPGWPARTGATVIRSPWSVPSILHWPAPNSRSSGASSARASPPARSPRCRQAIELVREAVRSGDDPHRDRRLRRWHRHRPGRTRDRLATSVAKPTSSPVLVRRECSDEDALFGEGPGGFILAGDKADLEKLGGQGVDVELIGEVGRQRNHRHRRQPQGRGPGRRSRSRLRFARRPHRIRPGRPHALASRLVDR